MYFKINILKLIPVVGRRYCIRCFSVVSTATKDDILVEQIDNITTIGINRPSKKNCLNNAVTEQLLETINEFENDKNSKAGVLYGTGGNFCAGFDLNEIANATGDTKNNLPQFKLMRKATKLCKKPLIAALNGYTIGAGLELALMCDLRIMEENAILGFFNRRFGIPILCGGTVILPAIVGYSRAMDLIITGRPLSAKEANSWGLVSQIVTCGAAVGTAINTALGITKFPQNSLLADRESIYNATISNKSIENALAFEQKNSELLQTGIENAKKFVNEGLGKRGKTFYESKRDYGYKEINEKFI